MASAPDPRGPTRGFIVGAASSHSGKTVATLGLIGALRARGVAVAAAKCGPDYIDPAFLAQATGAPAVNLDPWAMSRERARGLAADHAAGSELLVVEGVMGLLDGGAGGAGSTADLAEILGLPVLLVIDGRRLAQSAAAIAEGFRRLCDRVVVMGAIVNRVGSTRHRDLVREGFSRTDVPLLGVLPRKPGLVLPSRHLGLVQAAECRTLEEAIAASSGAVEAGVDLDAVMARATPLMPAPAVTGLPPPGQHIAIARDVAFAFAYAHLTEGWRMAGARVSFFSPLGDEPPDRNADFVYLPGGYPELHAGALAGADRFRAGVSAAVLRGAPVYGECGGFMALGEALTDADGVSHRMAGLLPLVTSFERPGLHLGYRRLEPLAGLPWAEPLSGHEFHYAGIVTEGEGDRLFRAATGAGEPLGTIGLRRGLAMGAFVHVIDRRPADPGR